MHGAHHHTTPQTNQGQPLKLYPQGRPTFPYPEWGLLLDRRRVALTSKCATLRLARRKRTPRLVSDCSIDSPTDSVVCESRTICLSHTLEEMMRVVILGRGASGKSSSIRNSRHSSFLNRYTTPLASPSNRQSTTLVGAKRACVDGCGSTHFHHPSLVPRKYWPRV